MRTSFMRPGTLAVPRGLSGKEGGERSASAPAGDSTKATASPIYKQVSPIISQIPERPFGGLALPWPSLIGIVGGALFGIAAMRSQYGQGGVPRVFFGALLGGTVGFAATVGVTSFAKGES